LVFISQLEEEISGGDLDFSELTGSRALGAAEALAEMGRPEDCFHLLEKLSTAADPWLLENRIEVALALFELAQRTDVERSILAAAEQLLLSLFEKDVEQVEAWTTLTQAERPTVVTLPVRWESGILPFLTQEYEKHQMATALSHLKLLKERYTVACRHVRAVFER
jgi:hypothetical protein